MNPVFLLPDVFHPTGGVPKNRFGIMLVSFLLGTPYELLAILGRPEPVEQIWTGVRGRGCIDRNPYDDFLAES